MISIGQASDRNMKARREKRETLTVSVAEPDAEACLEMKMKSVACWPVSAANVSSIRSICSMLSDRSHKKMCEADAHCHSSPHPSSATSGSPTCSHATRLFKASAMTLEATSSPCRVATTQVVAPDNFGRPVGCPSMHNGKLTLLQPLCTQHPRTAATEPRPLCTRESAGFCSKNGLAGCSVARTDNARTCILQTIAGVCSSLPAILTQTSAAGCQLKRYLSVYAWARHCRPAVCSCPWLIISI